MSNRVVAAIGAVLALALGFWAFSNDGRKSACDDFNVAILVVDAAAAKYFGTYGNTLPTTPRVDRFFEEATKFEHAYAQAPATIMSIGSMMTGKYPPTFFDSRKPFSLAAERTLAVTLEEAGFRTAAFSQNPWVSPRFGFGDGFDEFHLDRKQSMSEPVDPSQGELNYTGLVDDIVEWVDGVGRERFFLYVHLLPPHAPYDPPPPFAGRFDTNYDGPFRDEPMDVFRPDAHYGERDVEFLQGLYQEHLAFADSQIGRILDRLDERGLLDETLVVFTSDHGEAFDEHGRLSHGTTLYGEMIQVPLGIRWPGCMGEMPADWSGAVELRRLFATISEALGLPAGERDDSLLPMLRGDVPAEPVLVRSDVFTPIGLERLRSIVVWPYKLIASDRGWVELYNLVEDPGEAKDLAGELPDVVAKLKREQLRERPEIRLGEKADLGDGTREKLRALGYRVD